MVFPVWGLILHITSLEEFFFKWIKAYSLALVREGSE
jgi:hypothetical protein